jgi:WD40 repeat protein
VAARSETDARIVKRWATATGTETSQFEGHTFPVCGVRFSPDGHYLATCACASQNADAPHEVKVWDAVSGRALATMTGRGRLFNVAFSPDGRLLAWSGQEGLISLAQWDAMQPAVPIAGHQGDVTALVFSADGKLLASAGMDDRRVKIWSVTALMAGNAKELQALLAPSPICDLAFSPDNRRLAAISRDMVKMWDVETGHEALTLRGASQRYWDPSFNPRLAFSPDGTQLAGTNWDESISLWEAPLLDTEGQFAKFQDKRRRFADDRTPIWHLQEAELCLVYRNLKAATFHLNLVADAFRTGPLQQRTERAQQALKGSSR